MILGLDIKKLKGLRILIVDDESEIRETLSDFFEFEEAHASVAANGVEAMAILKTKEFDLVISDMRMPKANGMDLLRMMKTELKSAPPLIFLSGYSDVSESFAIKHGAKSFMQKPFSLEEIEQHSLNAVIRTQ